MTVTDLTYTTGTHLGQDQHLLSGPQGVVELWLGPVPSVEWHQRTQRADEEPDVEQCDVLGAPCWCDGSSSLGRRLAELGSGPELRAALEVAYRQVWPHREQVTP